ncbi:MAG: hypothetical protein K1X75_13270 [Leptospirales bacterium]|nr:hypothetical protein [Leptospirales bacterium]
MKLSVNIGRWIPRTVALAFALAEINGTRKHFMYESWPPHAQFHSLTGLSFYLGLTIFFFLITEIPFRRREWWAWWSIVIMGVCVHGAQLLVDALNAGLRGGGTSQGPGVMFWYLAMVGFSLYAVGAALTLPHFLKSGIDK